MLSSPFTLRNSESRSGSMTRWRSYAISVWLDRHDVGNFTDVELDALPLMIVSSSSILLAAIPSVEEIKFPILTWIFSCFFASIFLNIVSLALLLAARRFFRGGLAMAFIALVLGLGVLMFSIYNYAVNGVNASLPIYKAFAVPIVPGVFAAVLIWRWFRMLGEFRIIGKGR